MNGTKGFSGTALVGALFLSALLAAALFASACNDDDDDKPDAALIARGNYVVNHVAACVDCHTPRLPNGQPDGTKLLAGGLFADLDPTSDTIGAIYAPNLTPDSTGIKNWTDAEIKNAFQNGIDDDGEALFPIMPYYVFHNMTADDANAVVAYLRSLTPIHNEIPERQPLGFPFTQPAAPIPAASIPNTTLAANDPHYSNAVRGRYLSSMAGVCIECHTPSTVQAPVNLDSLFAGGKSFEIGGPFPPVVYSANITPDSTGIRGVTAEQIRTALLTGIDDDGEPICPPMPVGPNGAYGGLSQQDALDIGWYITTIRPLHNVVQDCAAPTSPGARKL